ncbi:hypothetical protein [Vampirovibrio chlorellavorus]|uniref:hypothetical protein n=1 Tax=Vampirovibrio chlorellavorus TaxID=758823 RepID=UPI0026EB5305|nr:hypothetical protein [Vampirovibrio chlorellavorus]
MTAAQKTSGAKPSPEAGFFSKERLTGAWRSVKHDLTSKDWWLKNGAIATAVTLATCWLPGSQLFTIPLWLGMDVLFSAMRGHQHYQDFPEKPAANAPKKPATQTPKQKQWRSKDRRNAAWKGLKQGIISGFRDNFQFKALLSGGLCLATCWLPGSQLLLIPSLFCTFAAWGGITQAIEGYENPGKGFKPSQTPSQQTGKAQAK